MVTFINVFFTSFWDKDIVVVCCWKEISTPYSRAARKIDCFLCQIVRWKEFAGNPVKAAHWKHSISEIQTTASPDKMKREARFFEKRTPGVELRLTFLQINCNQAKICSFDQGIFIKKPNILKTWQIYNQCHSLGCVHLCGQIGCWWGNAVEILLLYSNNLMYLLHDS